MFLAKVFILVTLSVLMNAARAGEEFDVQNVHMKGPVPIAIKKLLESDPMDECGFAGKRIAVVPPNKELWTVTTSCSGSGGSYTELALTSPDGAVKVMDAELVLDLAVIDSLTHGLPGIIATSGGSCCGVQRRSYIYDGAKYRKTADRSQQYLLGVRNNVPDELLDFFQNYTRDNECVQEELREKGDIGGFFIGPTDGKEWAFVVTSHCDVDENYPVWVIKVGPSPHIILSTFAPDSDIVFGPQMVGLPDVCFVDNDPKLDPRSVEPMSCWRYDGTLYKAGPKQSSDDLSN